MEVEGIWFDFLVIGLNPIEGRKKTPEKAMLKVGQTLEVTCKETR